MHCQHAYKPISRGLDMEPEWLCRKFMARGKGLETVDMVTGRRELILTELVPCKVARINDSMCGPSGTYFEHHEIKNIDE